MHVCISLKAVINYFKKRKLIDSSQVLKRKVNFVQCTDSAIAKICLVDETADGNTIHLFHNKEVCH